MLKIQTTFTFTRNTEYPGFYPFINQYARKNALFVIVDTELPCKKVPVCTSGANGLLSDQSQEQ